MVERVARAELLRVLGRRPLRHAVLLKHLAAFPDDTAGFRVLGDAGSAFLVLLDTRASAYDWAAYPGASHVVLLVSDHPALTARLLDAVPRGRGMVFKLASAADRDVVAGRFALERTAQFLSFTGGAAFQRCSGVWVGTEPGDGALSLFEAQGHSRAWLLPLLGAGRAFACCLPMGDDVGSACLAFESHGRVWEIGGVVTPEGLRGRGLAGRVVRTALALLGERGLMARYQVQEDNDASLALARKLGLRHFLTLEHHLHRPG